MDFHIKWFVLFLIYTLLLCASVASQSLHLSENEFESYIESLQNKRFEALSQEEKSGLAIAHFERGRTTERIFHLTMKTSKQYLGFLEAESAELNTRLKAVKNERVTNSTNQSLSFINRVLTEWYVEGLTEINCGGVNFTFSSNQSACWLLEAISSDEPSIQSLRNLLSEIESYPTTELVEKLNEMESAESKVQLIESVLNRIQVQFIADYIVSQLLFEERGNDTQAMLASYYARDWSQFTSQTDTIQQNSDIFFAVGHFIGQGNICTADSLPAQLNEFIGRNNVSKLLGMEALRRCMHESDLRALYGEFFTGYRPQNLDTGLYTASGLLAMGDVNSAYNKLSQIITRSTLTNLSVNKPEAMALLTHLKYEIKGEENWRDARDMLYVLQEEFSALGPSHLLLQLATNSGNRSSINIQID